MWARPPEILTTTLGGRYSCHSCFTDEEVDRKLTKLAGSHLVKEKWSLNPSSLSLVSLTINHLRLPQRTLDKGRKRIDRTS